MDMDAQELQKNCSKESPFCNGYIHFPVINPIDIYPQKSRVMTPVTHIYMAIKKGVIVVSPFITRRSPPCSNLVFFCLPHLESKYVNMWADFIVHTAGFC